MTAPASDGSRTAGVSSREGATRQPIVAAVALSVAVISLRPNILGELFNVVGVVALIIAALAVLVVQRGSTPIARGGVAMLLLVLFAEVWNVHRSAFTNSLTFESARGSVFAVVVVLAAMVALGPQSMTRFLLRALVVIVLVLSASQIITSALNVGGVEFAPYAQFPVGNYQALVRFPITIDVGEIRIGSVNVDRFSGLGREPGWMSMWAAVAWFVWPLLERPRWWGRVVLVAGVLLPISTAGFGIFVVVLAVDLLLRQAPNRSSAFVYLRTICAAAVLGGAVLLALQAPIVGLNAKADVSAASLDQRSDLTGDGVRALEELSLGGTGTGGSLNLVAAVAEHGWPYSLLVLSSLLVPLAVSRQPVAILPSMLVILLTAITAQPSEGSVFLSLVLIALGNLAPDHRLATRPTRSRRRSSSA